MSDVESKQAKTEVGEQPSSRGSNASDHRGSTEYLEALIHHGNSKKQGSAFLEKLYEILMNEEYESFISWCADGKSILIKRVEDFSQIVLPKYYKHNNFQSFVRQLNMYNFTKTSHDANRREFKQPLFRKGKRNLLPLICRKTQKSIRSMDSTIDHIDANDIFEVAHSQTEMLEGKPLIRCKSIDSCPAVSNSESSPLWEVVHELQMRVNTLEMKLYQVSKGKLCHKLDCTQSHHINCIHNPLPNYDSSNSSSCGHSDSNRSVGGPICKKVRSNSDKSISSASTTSGAGDLSFERAEKNRSRSISFSSCESDSAYGNICRSLERTCPRTRTKRGVDAILSAAEILHDGLPLPPASDVIRAHSDGVVLQSKKDDYEPQSIKKIKSSKARSTVMRESDLTETQGGDSNSDSSTSPLYFQDKDDNRPVPDSVARKPGLPLSRSSSIRDME